MRPLIACAVVLGWLGPTFVLAESFPFTAYTKAGAVQVRSGPGEQFAATDRLDRGTEVSVYRRDPGGWLAIRPPEGSFDWVEGRCFKLDDEGRLATATENEVPVRLGSRLGAFSANAEWQVKLDHGETAEVIGKKQVGDQLWYKISPPAGEFRWLREQEIGREPPPPGEDPSTPVQPAELIAPTNAAKSAAAETPPPTPPASAPKFATLEGGPGYTRLASGGDVSPTPENKSAAAPPLLTPLATSSSPAPAAAPKAPEPAPTADGFVPRQKNGEPRTASRAPTTNPVVVPPSTTLPSTGIPSFTSPPARSPAAPAVKPNLHGDDEVARELADLDIDLALVVSQEPTLWNFEPLRIRAEACSDAAGAPALRTRAREMMLKVADFETLRQRNLQLAALQANLPAKSASPATPANPPAATVSLAPLKLPPAAAGAVPVPAIPKPAEKTVASAPPAAAPDINISVPVPAQEKEKPTPPQFDGEGWLMPVITRRKDVPPFALTDDDGKLVGFVTPMPGVNLDRYKKQKIGVKGVRGFIDEFNKPHVTAERVKVIEATKLR